MVRWPCNDGVLCFAPPPVQIWYQWENVEDDQIFLYQPNGLSEVIKLERGVRQGSVLSPLLFLLVMDSLLIDLAYAGAGVSINGIYTRSLCHADDLRNIAPNMAARFTSLNLTWTTGVVRNF